MESNQLIDIRTLWARESEQSKEIERLKSEVLKAEKSLDHATPGVSAFSVLKFLKFDNITAWSAVDFPLFYS